MEKRKRRTKSEMESFRSLLTQEHSESISKNITTSACVYVGDINLIEEGDSEDDEELNALSATFLISDGKKELKVKAYKDYWALQRWVDKKDKDTKEVIGGDWVSFKYFANLGQLANRVFDFRLKNSDVENLNELTETARKICKEIKEEFEIKFKGVKK